MIVLDIYIYIYIYMYAVYGRSPLFNHAFFLVCIGSEIAQHLKVTGQICEHWDSLG